MSYWIEPVFDRTQEDVDFAIAKISEWIAADSVRNQLIVRDLKGCLNVSDINRIEGNIEYLAEKLGGYYYSPDTSTKSWTRVGMPNEKDISRITNNVRALVDAFCQRSDAPNIPTDMRNYKEVNAIELNLFLIRELVDVMVNSFRKSGAFYCGNRAIL